MLKNGGRKRNRRTKDALRPWAEPSQPRRQELLTIIKEKDNRIDDLERKLSRNSIQAEINAVHTENAELKKEIDEQSASFDTLLKSKLREIEKLEKKIEELKPFKLKVEKMEFDLGKKDIELERLKLQYSKKVLESDNKSFQIQKLKEQLKTMKETKSEEVVYEFPKKWKPDNNAQGYRYFNVVTGKWTYPTFDMVKVAQRMGITDINGNPVNVKKE